MGFLSNPTQASKGLKRPVSRGRKMDTGEVCAQDSHSLYLLLLTRGIARGIADDLESTSQKLE